MPLKDSLNKLKQQLSVAAGRSQPIIITTPRTVVAPPKGEDPAVIGMLQDLDRQVAAQKAAQDPGLTVIKAVDGVPIARFTNRQNADEVIAAQIRFITTTPPELQVRLIAEIIASEKDGELDKHFKKDKKDRDEDEVPAQQHLFKDLPLGTKWQVGEAMAQMYKQSERNWHGVTPSGKVTSLSRVDSRIDRVAVAQELVNNLLAIRPDSGPIVSPDFSSVAPPAARQFLDESKTLAEKHGHPSSDLPGFLKKRQ